MKYKELEQIFAAHEANQPIRIYSPTNLGVGVPFPREVSV